MPLALDFPIQSFRNFEFKETNIYQIKNGQKKNIRRQIMQLIMSNLKKIQSCNFK